MSTEVQTSSTYLPSPVSTTADEALLCNGCRMRYDATHRRPLVLQCLHSFCEMCIRAFARPKHDKKVTCNVCRATTKLDRNKAGSILPINHALLETLSASNRARPVTVIARSDSPVPRCSGLTGQYPTERVTVIPIHKNEANTDQSQRVSTSDGDDHRQSSGTTSISISQRRMPKDDRVTTTMASLPTSSEAKGLQLSMIVTVASSASGPRQLSCAAPQPASADGSCASLTNASCMAPCLAPTVTSLMVKSSASTFHPSQATGGTSSEANQPPAPVDLCCQCRMHLATLTVASATQMSSKKLCSNCYALIQQHKLDGEGESPARSHVPLRRSPQNASGGSEIPSTTVIKVLDENNTGASCSCVASQSSTVNCSALFSLSVLSDGEGHRGSIHVDGKRIASPVQKPSMVRGSAANTETTIVLDNSPKESDRKPPVKPTYVACSKFDLRTEATDKKRLENLSTVSGSNEEYPQCAHADDTDVNSEEIYRPLPYNPGFVDIGLDPCLELRPPPVGEARHPVLPTEKQQLELQAAAYPGGSKYPYPAQGPPRYEEVISQGVSSAEPPPVHSASVRCVNAFGKYGELATQPGAFRSPTRINVSRGGVVVVTDSVLRTVQAFNAAGECLALIRVSANTANGCSCYDKKKLAVGTNCGVQVYNFNGTLKKTIPLGPVINTVTASHGQGFIAVQPKALSIFRGPTESLVRTLRDSSKPGPFRQPMPFDSIADAAVNSQQDIVVLDAGAASGLGMIFIVSDDGYLKNCIVPGRDLCGVLRQPTAVAVDWAHNIVVSDSGNRRVLLFAANGKFHRQLIGPGHGDDLKTWPIGLDISDDGRLFVIVKGDKFAEIRVFTYH